MRDILVDMTVCEIEGWDKLEYIDDLCSLIHSLRFYSPTAENEGGAK